MTKQVEKITVVSEGLMGRSQFVVMTNYDRRYTIEPKTYFGSKVAPTEGNKIEFYRNSPNYSVRDFTLGD